MKLSVAMATYNGGAYLLEQLASIIAQTRLPDELVVCDDRSTDNTVEIAESIARTAPFPVKLSVNGRNLGSTQNFARAIELCMGDIIALADQDDVWHPDKLLRTEAAFIAAPDVGCVFGDAELVDESLRSLGRRLYQGLGLSRRERRLLEGGEIFELLLRGNIVFGATMAFRSRFKPLVLPIPAFPDEIDLMHDGWIALLIAAVAEMALIREPLIDYRQHPGQETGVRQIGARRRPARTALRQSLANARRARSDPHAAWASVFEHALGRVEAHGGDPSHRRRSAQLRAKITHLRGRVQLPRGRLRRVPFILQELLTSRYHAYSNGLASAARDLWV